MYRTDIVVALQTDLSQSRATSAAAIVRSATGLNPSEFISKFGGQVRQLNPRHQQQQQQQSGQQTKSRTDSLPSKDVIAHVATERPFVSTQAGTKWDRIQKIREMSDNLQVMDQRYQIICK